MKLTKKKIDTFQYDRSKGKKDIRWDEKLSGFGIRIYQSGKKSFVVFYRTNGRQRLMTLGKYGVLNLDEARKDATAVQDYIAVESGPR